MRSRYKGSNKSNVRLLKKIALLFIIVTVLVIANKYVSKEDSVDIKLITIIESKQ